MQHGEKTSTSFLCWLSGFLRVIYCCCTSHLIILSYLDYHTPARIIHRNTENKTFQSSEKQDISAHSTSDFKVHCSALPLIRHSSFRPDSKTLFNSRSVSCISAVGRHLSTTARSKKYRFGSHCPVCMNGDYVMRFHAKNVYLSLFTMHGGSEPQSRHNITTSMWLFNSLRHFWILIVLLRQTFLHHKYPSAYLDTPQ